MARQAASERTETAAVTAAVTAAEEAGPAPAGRGTGRRAVVAAVGAAGLTAALAACGGGMSDAGSGGSKAAGDDQAAPETSGGGGDDGAGGAGGSGADGSAGGDSGPALAKTSEIPKGGGKIFKGEKVVVTQPQDGDIKAFSAICTHAGCVVGEVSGGTINCMCHGSKFDITDGSVKTGPATKGLAPAKVTVKGGSVTLG